MMFRNLSDGSKALVFYTIVFSLSVAAAFAAPLVGESILLVTMCTPLLTVLLMLLVVTRDGYSKAGWAMLGLHRAGFSAWGLALTMPLLMLSFGYGVVWLTGIASVNLPASGLVPLVPDLAIGLIASTCFAFAEEIGWRGYLLPHLATGGRTRALLLSGLLHGLWHMPVLLLTPYYHNVGSPWIVAPLFLATLTVAGVVYGYLRLTTDSVWPATISHGALNTFWSLFAMITATASPVALEYLAGETGILPLLALLAIAGGLAYRLKQRAQAEVGGLGKHAWTKELAR